MIILNVKSVTVNSLFSVDLLKDQEQTNVIDARKLVQLQNGHVLKVENFHKREHPIQWYTMKVNAIFMVVWMMIIINSMMYGSLILQVVNGNIQNQVPHPINQSEDQDIVLKSITVKCTSLVVFMNWLKKLMR